MGNLPNSESKETLSRALECLISGEFDPITGLETRHWSERCVEVPWAASLLTSPGQMLDVGWSMSPPEWLGVLLAASDRGAKLVGIDIIDPERVKSRYPADLIESIFAIPVRVESVLDAQPNGELFDTITCISTLEHIGFDVASPADETSTAFIRANSAEFAISERDSKTDGRFLDAAHRLMKVGGSILLSVPAGTGGPILHQDSLGLFTHQFEYDPESWAAILRDPRFGIDDEYYFKHDAELGWLQASDCDELAEQTSVLKPFATGCAMARLVKL